MMARKMKKMRKEVVKLVPTMEEEVAKAEKEMHEVMEWETPEQREAADFRKTAAQMHRLLHVARGQIDDMVETMEAKFREQQADMQKQKEAMESSLREQQTILEMQGKVEDVGPTIEETRMNLVVQICQISIARCAGRTMGQTNSQ